MSDPRDARIQELERELAVRDAKLAEQATKLAEQATKLAEQAEAIAALKQQVAKLLEQLNQNSSNSHKPPSSDPPGKRNPQRNKDKRNRKKRKRGGQKGHKGSRRELLPPEQVDDFVHHFPSQCESCWLALPQVHDKDAQREQVIEVPPIRPHVTEHQRHAVTCPHCRFVTKARHDAMPKSPFGPRLMALIALFTGVYHVSRRRTQELLGDVLGVTMSLGAISTVEARVSAAIEPAVDEAWERAKDADVKHTDGTSWLQAGKSLSLWVLATAAATVYRIVANGAADTLKPLFGELKGILVSDRATALLFWPMGFRQVCWAHLLRKFVSFSERDGPAGQLGLELLNYTGLLFQYWRDHRNGQITDERFSAWMAPVRKQVEAALKKGVALDIKGVSGSCADILKYRRALWTFVDRFDVDPTNNHGERELRGFVLWRKRCFGTQSERGNLFAERIMTVAHTARKQGRNVLAFLTASCRGEGPSLFESA